jgi:hypothetical protein
MQRSDGAVDGRVRDRPRHRLVKLLAGVAIGAAKVAGVIDRQNQAESLIQAALSSDINSVPRHN